MTDKIKPEDARNVLAENTAQAVRKHLDALERNRQFMQTRWIWELLQNARDAQASMASIECDGEYVAFRHDGDSFTRDEIAHLIYHGSTKIENEDAIGQYGSGFLTTHLLSSSIHISGRVDTGNFFNFILKREGSAKYLKLLMEDAREKFNKSLSDQSASLGDFTTEFRYPIKCNRVEVARDGIEMLKRCAPWVLAFNQFSSIEIKSPDKVVKFKVIRNSWKNGLQAIIVSKNEIEQGFILMAKGENSKTSVAIPVQKVSADSERYLVSDVINMPKLFLGFPLVNTEDFSFPAVINSFQFTPTEDRDGVNLATGTDDANERNQRAVESAWNLLINLLKSAAACNFRGIYKLAKISPIPQHKWLKREWLQEVNERFVAEIRKTPAVVVGDKNSPISPENAILPVAETDDGVHTLWCLLSEMQENDVRLPEKEEATGWCNVVNSWTKASDRHPDMGFNCQKLAAEIDRRNAGQTTSIESILSLKHGVDTIEWLNRFHALIGQEELRNDVAECRIVPSQYGQLRKFSDLHRDAGVDEELKDIAELLGWPIRRELRDIRVDSLGDEYGAGDLDSERVVKRLIEKLRDRGEENPDNDFAKASARIFRWITGQRNWDLLDNFPAFAEKDHDDGSKKVIRMQRLQKDAGEYPYLAPVRAWQDDLQKYAGLFPKRHMLADAFFEAAPESRSDVWRSLNEEGFAKNCVIIKTAKKDLEPIPDDDTKDKGEEKHLPAESVAVTNIAFLKKEDVGIMARAPKSQPRARLFWRFLVDWLLVQEPQGLENQLAECADPDCDAEHEYPPAEWLVPVKKNQWVPAGNRKTALANAESLSALFQNAPNDCPQNTDGLARLLEAIDVNNPDLFRIGLADPEKQKALVSLLDSGNLDIAYEIVEDFKDDPELRGYLADRKKQKQTAQKNRELGEQVEELVREILEKEGDFKVDKIRVGADFEITPDFEIDDVTKFELASPSQSKWLVEVKATRQGPDGVRMTLVQAREANNNKENYLLCVVPLDGDAPERGIVRKKMRFVQNIGNDVAKLVRDFDEFKNRRDNIMADKDQDVQLSISPGMERILIKSSMWEDRKRGFPLNKLAERLKP